jgi:hypothetical protein
MNLKLFFGGSGLGPEPSICLEGLKKIKETVRIACIAVDIET